jgi:cysteine desulfurase / selenocysteine lyase
VPATARASFYVYSTRDDVDALVKGVERVNEIFG